MLYIGIDPGLDGGLAAIRHNEVVAAVAMPVYTTTVKRNKKTVKKRHLFCFGILSWFNSVMYCWPGHEPYEMYCHLAVEAVSARPKQGVTSMFTFGKGVGTLLGMISVLDFTNENFKYIEVSPKKWKNVVLPNTTKDKNAAIQFVKDKFPDVSLLPTARHSVPHDGIADAICLAYYAQSMQPGELINDGKEKTGSKKAVK